MGGYGSPMTRAACRARWHPWGPRSVLARWSDVPAAPLQGAVQREFEAGIEIGGRGRSRARA